MAWTESELTELKRLASPNQLFMAEIAMKLNKRPAAVRHMAHKIGVWSKPENRMGKWNAKHAHIRESVMSYFLTHSAEETADHFGMTQSEFKSCMTYGYRDPALKHLRKEVRPHSSWTGEDWRFMVAHVGVQPRRWIGRKLKRGDTYNPVKDALAKFRGKGKYFNGMPWGWAQQVFGEEALKLTIRTKAGPTGRGYHNKAEVFRYRLLTWTDAETLLERGLTRSTPGHGRWNRKNKPDKRIRISTELAIAIRAMARFQRWIHGAQSTRKVRSNIQAALRKR